VIQLTHGMGEHAQRYDYVARARRHRRADQLGRPRRGQLGPERIGLAAARCGAWWRITGMNPG